MNPPNLPTVPRRLVVKVAAALSTALVGMASARRLGGDRVRAVRQEQTPAAGTPTLPPTPTCDDDDPDETPRQAAGPFFTPNSPERTSLLDPGLSGTRLLLRGSVVSTDCRPVAGALLDFWQADDGGAYDNVGFTLRGHQFTDDDGRFELETIVPGLYPGRARHIHVHAQAPDRPVLTTQLYFPDEPDNRTDRIFAPELVMAVAAAADGDGREARFDFVLDTD